MTVSTKSIKYGELTYFYYNWYLIKLNIGRIRGDRFLLFNVDDNDKIISAIYGKIKDDEYNLEDFKIKGWLINKDVCNFGNRKELKTYSFYKFPYLMVGFGNKGEELENEAKMLLSEPETYFTEQKVR